MGEMMFLNRMFCVLRTLTEPTSSSEKPECMKKTSAPPSTSHMRSMPVLDFAISPFRASMAFAVSTCEGRVSRSGFGEQQRRSASSG